MEIHTKEFKEFVVKEITQLVEKHKTDLPEIRSYQFECKQDLSIAVYVILDNFSIRDKKHGHLLKIESPIESLASHTEIYTTTLELKRGLVNTSFKVFIIFH